jgi:hypothetical protein
MNERLSLEGTLSSSFVQSSFALTAMTRVTVVKFIALSRNHKLKWIGFSVENESFSSSNWMIYGGVEDWLECW